MRNNPDRSLRKKFFFYTVPYTFRTIVWYSNRFQLMFSIMNSFIIKSIILYVQLIQFLQVLNYVHHFVDFDDDETNCRGDPTFEYRILLLYLVWILLSEFGARHEIVLVLKTCIYRSKVISWEENLYNGLYGFRTQNAFLY